MLYRKSAIRKATSLSNIVTVGVSHCYGAQAVALTFPNGFKFSYSGDCRPCRDFAIIGKGSTVLLHEATFDDELVGDAEAKKHSTTSEAVGVGVAMGARRVILTHFSQRYQRIPSTDSMKSISVKLEDTEEAEDPMEGMEPPINVEDQPLLETQTTLNPSKEDLGQEKAQEERISDAKSQTRTNQPTEPALSPRFASLNSMNNLTRPPTNDMKIGVAFDYMRVKVGDIMHLERFTPAFRELYKEVEKEEAEGKTKRAAKEAFSDDEKSVSPPKAKGTKAIVKEVVDMKVEAVNNRRGGRKEKTSLSGKNDKGEAERSHTIPPTLIEDTKADASPQPPDESSTAANETHKIVWKHLALDRPAETTPPAAPISDNAAAPNSLALDTPAIDRPASPAS